jgi:hypothetical protein
MLRDSEEDLDRLETTHGAAMRRPPNFFVCTVAVLATPPKRHIKREREREREREKQPTPTTLANAKK